MIHDLQTFLRLLSKRLWSACHITTRFFKIPVYELLDVRLECTVGLQRSFGSVHAMLAHQHLGLIDILLPLDNEERRRLREFLFGYEILWIEDVALGDDDEDG